MSSGAMSHRMELVVEGMDRSVLFYNNVLGFEMIRRHGCSARDGAGDHPVTEPAQRR